MCPNRPSCRSSRIAPPSCRPGVHSGAGYFRSSVTLSEFQNAQNRSAYPSARCGYSLATAVRPLCRGCAALNFDIFARGCMTLRRGSAGCHAVTPVSISVSSSGRVVRARSTTTFVGTFTSTPGSCLVQLRAAFTRVRVPANFVAREQRPGRRWVCGSGRRRAWLKFRSKIENRDHGDLIWTCASRHKVDAPNEITGRA